MAKVIFVLALSVVFLTLAVVPVDAGNVSAQNFNLPVAAQRLSCWVVSDTVTLSMDRPEICSNPPEAYWIRCNVYGDTETIPGPNPWRVRLLKCR